MKKYLSFTWILGLLLLAAGGFVFLIKGVMETFTVSILWAGLVLLLISFYINFSDIKDLISKRSTRYGFNTAVMVGIFIAIIALTAVMSMKYKFR